MRFELDPNVEMTYSEYDRSTHDIWRVSHAERDLIQYLGENVGKCWGGSYKFPMRGDGWCMHLGFGEDPQLDDYAWRYVTGTHRYKPKGLFGHWLQVDDDAKAVMLRLSGVLDPCLWTGLRPHRSTTVSMHRSSFDPNYPKFYRS